MAAHPLRPIPICPTTPAPVTPMSPVTPPRSTHHRSHLKGTYLSRTRHTYTIPTIPLKITELCGGLSTGLEAIEKAGYKVAFYTWADNVPRRSNGGFSPSFPINIRISGSPPTGATPEWDSRLLMDARFISPEVFTNVILEGVDIILKSPPLMAQHLPTTHRGNTFPDPQLLALLIRYRNEAHPRGVGFIWNTTKSTYSGLQDKCSRKGGTTDRERLVCSQKTCSFLDCGRGYSGSM
jgi:hypothetical protein